jgi:spore maturation protein CgeB
MNQKASNNRKIKVLFIGLKHDYGYPHRGYSYEYVNFYDTLLHMENVSVTLFPFDEIMREVGGKAMNRRLLEIVSTLNPDICFFMLFTDEIKKETLATMKKQNKTVTVNWFTDDHWRFTEYSQYWAPLFHWSVTTDSESIDKYRRIGYHNVILSQWGANHFLYKHYDTPFEYDVTFTGQAHSNRKNIINILKNSGINVDCWGSGWPNGRLSQEEMIMLFSKSRINLNLSEGTVVLNAKQLGKIFLNRRADNTYALKSPCEISNRIKTMLTPSRTQIKGRNFEISASGGFLLTQHADKIEKYFVPGKEIEVFASTKELSDKIRYYLSHDLEREKIRLAGYERTLREHTLEKRLNDIFKKIIAS